METMSSVSLEQELALIVKKHDEAVKRLHTETLQRVSSLSIEDEKKAASEAVTLYSKLSSDTERAQAIEKDNQERIKEVKSMLQLEYEALKERDIAPDKSALNEVISEHQHQLRDSEKKQEKLKSQRKMFDTHRLHRNLQKKVAHLQFDLSSTDSHVKGYFQMPSGDLKTFDFNLEEDSSCYISNFMWDSI